MKKYILTFLFSFFVLISNISALEVDIKSENILLYNLKDNKVIYERNSKENTSIASLTKIVTVLVAIENIDDINNNVTLTSDVFTDLIELDASVAGFTEGEIVTYEDLLYGAMLPSGADASRALAINLFGNEESFVNKMNDFMTKLNIKTTVFTNTSGLDEEGQKATLNDLLTIMLYGLNNETFTKIFNACSYTTSNGRLTLKSTLNYYENRFSINTNIITGGKTGYTDLAGLCLLSYIKNEDLKLLIITTNAPVEENRFPYNVTDALTIYNYYLDNYDYHTILKKNDIVTTVNSKNSKYKFANLIYKDEDIKYLLPNDYKKTDLIFDFNVLEYVSFTTDINKPIGTFTINYNGNDIFIGDLFLKEKIDFNLLSFISNNIFIFSSLTIIIVLIFIKKRKKI